MAILLIPIVGSLALATEVSGWYSTQRSMQNAADSAAIAAATSERTTAPTYITEAQAVSARYGFTNGSNNTTVTAVNNQTCPDGNTDCYLVTITRNVSLQLVRVAGFSGNQSSGSKESVIATAMAEPHSINQENCIITLAGDFTISGGPNFNLGGCAVESDGNLKCSGNGSGTDQNGIAYVDFGISAGSAVGSIKGNCGPGANQTTISSVTDPFSGLSINANIPTTMPPGCKTGTGLNVPAGSTIDATSGSVCYSTSPNITGSSGTVTVNTAAGGSVLYIYGGGNLNVPSGVTFQAAFGSGLTVVFTGPAGNNTPGFLTGNGTFDWGAPTSGTWSGVAGLPG